MKINIKDKFILLSFLFGLLVWVCDAVVDFFFFYEKSFLSVLILDLSAYEIYFRLIILGLFVIFGIIVSKITSRHKKLETIYRDSEKKFKAIFDQIADYILVLEPVKNGPPIIVDCNDSACEMHGYTKEELLGKPISFLDDEESKKLIPERMQMSGPGKKITFEVCHVRKDGSKFQVEVVSKEINIEGHTFIYTIERDISNRKEFERQVNNNRKLEALKTLAIGISNDFKNIIETIHLNAKCALNDTSSGSDANNYIEQILSCSRRANELIDQLGHITGNDAKEKVIIDTGYITKKCIEELAITLPVNISIESDISGDSLSILSDPEQFRVIIINLATNAIRAMKDTGGILTVSVHNIYISNTTSDIDLSPGHYVRLSIGDNGPGIPAEIKDRIFDPFFSTEPDGSARGLGLSIVYGLVLSNKGSINLKTVPEKGTIYDIFFPGVDISDSIEDENNITDYKGTERILFIDDEKAIIRAGKKILEKQGYMVTTESDGLKALELFRKDPQQYDLVIADMTMKKISGIELAQKMNEIKPNVKIIISTGYIKISESKLKKIGFMGHITKPVTKKQLLETVRTVLNHKRKNPLELLN